MNSPAAVEQRCLDSLIISPNSLGGNKRSISRKICPTTWMARVGLRPMPHCNQTTDSLNARLSAAALCTVLVLTGLTLSGCSTEVAYVPPDEAGGTSSSPSGNSPASTPEGETGLEDAPGFDPPAVDVPTDLMGQDDSSASDASQPAETPTEPPAETIRQPPTDNRYGSISSQPAESEAKTASQPAALPWETGGRYSNEGSSNEDTDSGPNYQEMFGRATSSNDDSDQQPQTIETKSATAPQQRSDKELAAEGIFPWESDTPPAGKRAAEPSGNEFAESSPSGVSDASDDSRNDDSSNIEEILFGMDDDEPKPETRGWKKLDPPSTTEQQPEELAEPVSEPDTASDTTSDPAAMFGSLLSEMESEVDDAAEEINSDSTQPAADDSSSIGETTVESPQVEELPPMPVPEVEENVEPFALEPEVEQPAPTESEIAEPARELAPPEPLAPAPLEPGNTRRLAWLLGSKASLAALPDLPDPSTDGQGWQLSAIADLLGVDLPEVSSTGSTSTKSESLSKLLSESSRVGNQLQQRHGGDHAALLEIATKTNLLLAVYADSPRLAKPIRRAVANAANRASLPNDVWQPLVDMLGRSPSPIEVRQAVFTLHKNAEQALRAQRPTATETFSR